MSEFTTTRVAVGLSAWLIVVAPLEQQEASAQQPDDIEAVQAVHEAFHEAFGNEDIDLMSEVWLHDDSVRLIVPPAQEPLAGWEAIRSSFEQTFAELDVVSLSMDGVHVIVGPEFAWIVEVHGFEMELNEGVITAPFFATNVFQKVDGRWFMVAHHASAPPPPAEQ